VCCKWISLAGNYIVLGFPTLGFSLALPKFLSISWLNDCCSLCLFSCKST
jgi:hypothetical protein